jgi:hypothetical protein
MDDPEFTEVLTDVLKDDDKAKEAIKGLTAMMNLIGSSFGPETNDGK